MLNEILEALSPLLLAAVAALLTLFLGWLTVTFHRQFGTEIEAKHREALHSAMMMGVSRATELDGDPNAITREALAYAKRSVADAIRALGANDDILWDLAEAKIRQVIGR